MAVVPISYDFDTIDATEIFIKVIRRVKDIRLVFLPNRINTTENRADEMKQREETVLTRGQSLCEQSGFTEKPPRQRMWRRGL